ncbi:MAG TPA: alkaline phosphatase family protein [Actinomycetota bacterium]
MRRSTAARNLHFRKRRRRRLLPLVALVVVVAAAGGGVAWWQLGADDGPTDAEAAVPACEISPDILQRVWRGYVPKRSGEVLAIERLPHQWGSRHSTPYKYTQHVPLVLYGPGFIEPGEYDGDVTVADMAPTFARLLDYDDFPDRDGRALDEALLPEEERAGTPRLIFTLVWDGGGWNGLEEWPDAWPNLSDLIEKSASFTNANVGSSPSITPSIHATIGTGDFPRSHGLSDVRMRVNGKMVDATEGDSPRYLRVQTLGDLWDQANDNVPEVGVFARDGWHLGMIGHGADVNGGDKDLAVLDNLGGVNFHTNEDYYYMPTYMDGTEGLAEAADEIDLRDGEADQSWLGNALITFDGSIRYTPAWNIYQTQKLEELLENEGYGQDEVADLFYTNYKSVDLAGHEWGMTEPEVRDDIIEQDAQLPKIIRLLNRLVGKNNYVFALTADHGMQPLSDVTGGWNINTAEMTDDMERRFDKTTPNIPFMLSNRGYQYILNSKEMRRNDITAEQVASFIRNYRIKDNVVGGGRVPRAFEGRENERLFLTALTPPAWKRALDCATERVAFQRDRDKRSFATRARNNGLPKT